MNLLLSILILASSGRATEWNFLTDGENRGPHTVAELKDFYSKGEINDETPFWNVPSVRLSVPCLPFLGESDKESAWIELSKLPTLRDEICKRAVASGGTCSPPMGALRLMAGNSDDDTDDDPVFSDDEYEDNTDSSVGSGDSTGADTTKGTDYKKQSQTLKDQWENMKQQATANMAKKKAMRKLLRDLLKKIKNPKIKNPTAEETKQYGLENGLHGEELDEFVGKVKNPTFADVGHTVEVFHRGVVLDVVVLDVYKEQLQELHNDEGWDCTFCDEYYDMFRSILQQAIQPPQTEEQIRNKKLYDFYYPSSAKCPRDNFNTKIVDVLTPRGGPDYKIEEEDDYIYGLSLGNTLIKLVNCFKHGDTSYIATVSERILEGLKTFQTGLNKHILSICDKGNFHEIKETGDDDEANTSTGKMRAQNFYLKVEDLKAILQDMIKTSYTIDNIKEDINSHIVDNEMIEKGYPEDGKGRTPHHIGVKYVEGLQKIAELERTLRKLLKSQRWQ